MDDNLVSHLITVEEELVLELFSKAEESNLGGGCALFLYLLLVALLQEKLLHALNGAKVRALHVLVSEDRISYLDLYAKRKTRYQISY